MKPLADPVHAALSLRGTPLRFAIIALTAIGLAGCQASATNDFKSKFNKIQLDMTEAQVDELLAAYPAGIEELTAIEKELYGPPDGPCKRAPLFRKHYAEKPDAIERDYYIEVFFDDNYMVVNKLLGEYIK